MNVSTAIKIVELHKQKEKLAAQLRRFLATGHNNGVVLAKKAKKKHAASSARQSHGRYMGLIRHLNKSQRKAVATFRKKEGIGPAISFAKKLNAERQKSAD